MNELILKFEDDRGINRIESLLMIALDVIEQMRFCYKGKDELEEIITDEFLFRDLLNQVREQMVD